MTSNTPEMQALLPVTAEDRDAAADMVERDVNGVHTGERSWHIRGGHLDGDYRVQAFARHRISHSLPGDVGTVDLEAVAKEICDAVYPHHVIKYDTPAAIRSVVRILAALPQAARAPQGYWLIERRCDPPQWSIEPRPTGIGAFYSDIHRAHCFASKDEASEAMRNMSITNKERGEYFVSEHVWIEHD